MQDLHKLYLGIPSHQLPLKLLRRPRPGAKKITIRKHNPMGTVAELVSWMLLLLGVCAPTGNRLYASINVARERLNWEDSSKLSKIWGVFWRARSKFRQQLGEGRECRGEFLPIKLRYAVRTSVPQGIIESNHQFLFFCFKRWISMLKKAIVGGQRKKHQQRPRHACTLQSQP